jgi:putative component of toxin-antitoxin plasmid stabilization module
MQRLENQARAAAEQLFQDVAEVQFVETSSAGEHVFDARRRSGSTARVTLNPNGIRACVEWSDHQGSGYRIFRLRGLVGPQGSPSETTPCLSPTVGVLP